MDNMDTQLKEKAQKIMDFTEENICNHCLGRKFSLEIEGPGNPRRGEKIRDILGEKDPEASSLQNCIICNDIFKHLDETAALVEAKIDSLDLEYSSFLVGCKLPDDILQRDEELSAEIGVEVESIKREVNRELGKLLEKQLEKEVDFDAPQLVIMVNFTKKPTRINIQINPLFIEGRYLKLIRGIPQTKWPCRKCKGRGCESCDFTGKMYKESVEELISATVLKVTKGREGKFHGAGREDIDVRMLGNGRPFVLEIKEPRRRTMDLEKITQDINISAAEKIEVRDLKFSVRSRKAEIKTSSPDTYKVYRALAQLEDEITEEQLNDLQNLHIIKQRTPIRVSHRRADKVRTREVMDIKARIINSKLLELTIKTQGGLYIKELISGDEGRSQPNVSEVLGTPAKCIELDVLEVGS